MAYLCRPTKNHMKYHELKNIVNKYDPALVMDGVLPFKYRSKIKMVFVSIAIILLALWAVSSFFTLPNVDIRFIQGFSFIFLGIFILAFALDTYYYDIFFSDLEITIPEPHFKNSDQTGSFVTAKIIRDTKDGDVVSELLKSSVGQALMMRLDVPQKELLDFISQKKNKITPLVIAEMEISNDESNLFENYVLSLYKIDKEFYDFLFKYSIRENELRGVVKWIIEKFDKKNKRRRWWGRDNLNKIQGIGNDWAYGEAYELEKYARKIEEMYDFLAYGLGKHQKEVAEIESVLSKSKEGNVLLVSEDDLKKIDVITEFSKKILGGKTSPMFENKVIYILNINDILIGKKEKFDFENEIIKIFNEAVRAGNIILVISNFPSAIVGSQILGSDLVALILPYFSSNSLNIIALSDAKSFHEHIENNTSLMEKLEVMILTEDNQDSLISSLEKRTEDLEQRYGVFFTYGSIVAVAESASRYFMGQNVSDKAVDILVELPLFVLKQGRIEITKKDVSDMVQVKTGIPVGEIKEDEKEKLLNLEKILHTKIIGQNEAVSAIGSAMRRSRSGIESEKRPMGSFLFLGPTGVGKTETAKALSDVFFGNDKKIIRLDMSEYNSPDSVSRLIGSFESGKQGILSSLLRENQYGVLLLDEFEKANNEVHNLFLQILDEGFFSDMTGKKVNARNLIIIATSNAGSSIIWDYTKQGKNLAESKQSIIDAIIHEGHFKPELLNRFDGVVLFHPLTEDNLKQVAKIMLERLAKRLEGKSLELVITDDLINYLVEKGSDPLFGARPINRAIQDDVEEIIARKLIGGDVFPGSKVILTKEDLALK